MLMIMFVMTKYFKNVQLHKFKCIFAHFLIFFLEEVNQFTVISRLHVYLCFQYLALSFIINIRIFVGVISSIILMC